MHKEKDLTKSIEQVRCSNPDDEIIKQNFNLFPSAKSSGQRKKEISMTSESKRSNRS